MEGKDAITAAIIADAEKKAEAVINDALAETEELMQKTRNELARRENERIAEAKEDAVRAVNRRATLAALDGRKAVLAAKQTVMDKVYDAAVTKILNMTDNVYRDFIGGLVKRYADDGDEIMIAERDAKRLNYDWAESLGRSIGKDITLSRKYHSGRGGISRVGDKCDKNLTLDAAVKQLRPLCEGEIAAKLFGSNGKRNTDGNN